jgi:phage-related minor tail protein
MDNTEDLNINIGANPAGVEAGSKAAAAAVSKVVKEANDLDRSFKQLRSSLDPMYAAQIKYNDSLAALDKLLAEGRIGEDEYAKSILRATAALKEQAAAQLKGTAVSRDAIAAQKASATSRVEAESAANSAVISGTRTTVAAREAEEARLTAAMAREERTRTAAVLAEAKVRAEAAKAALASPLPAVNRGASGRFIPAEVVAADRAAAAEEAANLLQLAQIEDTLAAQRVRNTQRIVTTREEAARRAQVADKATAEVAVTTAAQAAESDAAAVVAAQALAAAQEQAAAVAIAAAQTQQAADQAFAEATAAKAKAAAAAAIAEEKEAKAIAEKAKADAAAVLETRKAEKAAADEAIAEGRRVQAANRLRAALDPLFAAQMRYNAAVKEATVLAASGHIDEPTRLNAVTAAEKALTDATKAGTGARISNKAATESLVLVHEGLQHRFTRMAGSAMILSQALVGAGNSASLFQMLLSPVGLAIGVTVAAIAALTVAAYKGAMEQVRLQRALEVTGQYAGVTAGQVEEAGRKIAEATDTSSNQATASLETIVASGRVTSATLITMGEIVQRLALLTGQKSEEIAADMVKMADDPAAAMKRLNEQYHFLTPTQEQHIRNLIEEGRKTEAVAELSGSFNSALKSEQVQLSGLAGWAHTAAVAMGNLWESMKNIGKASTGVARLQEINEQLKKDDWANRNLDVFGLWAKKKAALMAEAAAIQKKMGADEIKTRQAQQSQQAHDEREALDQLGMSTRTAHAKAQREMQAWRNEAKALLSNPMASAEDRQEAQYKLGHARETDAAINRRYDRGDQPKVGRTPKGPSQVSLWTNDLHQMEEASGEFFKGEVAKELAFWTEKLTHAKAGSKEYLAIQSKIFALQKREAKSNYADQIEVLKAKIEEEKGDVEGEEKAWQAYLTKVKTVMGATSKEYIAAAAEYRKAQVEIAETQAKLMARGEQAKEQPLTRQNEDTQTGTQMKSSAIDYDLQQNLINDRKAAEAHKALLTEELQDEVNYENALDAMRLDSLQKQLLIPNLARDKIAEIQLQIEQLEQQHQNTLNSIRNKGLIEYQRVNQQMLTAVQQRWASMTDGITNSLSSTLKGALQGTLNWRSAMANLIDSVTNVWVDAGIKQLNSWIRSLFIKRAVTTASEAATTATHVAAEGVKTAATVTGVAVRTGAEITGHATTTAVSATSALTQIAHAAAVAAANVYKAIAAIPYVGPFLAPAAAAAALYAVYRFGSAIISAEGGQAEVPEDGQISMLHKKEMVLPAWAAVPLRQQLRARSSSDGVFSGASDAGRVSRDAGSRDVTFNYQPQNSLQNMSMREMLQRDGRELRRWLKNEHRNGNLDFAKRA